MRWSSGSHLAQTTYLWNISDMEETVASYCSYCPVANRNPQLYPWHRACSTITQNRNHTPCSYIIREVARILSCIQTVTCRGITLNSFISKVLESLILDRLEQCSCVPHPNQIAYRKRVSCADNISSPHKRWSTDTFRIAARCTCASQLVYKRPWFGRVSFAPEEIVWHGSKLQDMGILRSWYVYRLPELHTSEKIRLCLSLFLLDVGWGKVTFFQQPCSCLSWISQC